MKLGSLHIDIDKDKTLTPNEICNYLYEYPEANLFLTTLLYNNSLGFAFLDVPSDIFKTEDGYKVVFSKEFLKEMKIEDLTDTIIPFDAMPKNCFNLKNRNKLHSYLVFYDCSEESDYCQDSDVLMIYDDEKSSMRTLAEYFFEKYEINTMKKVRDEMKKAREIYKKDIGSDEDPFDFSYLYDSDNQDFPSF